MLKDELNELLKHEVGEVLRTPSLLMQMLRLYSKIFLHDEACSTCEKKHAGYYSHLASKGFQQIEKNKTMSNKELKYKLKPGIIMHSPDGMFSEFNITDEISERLVKNFPALAGNYINPPVINPEPVKVEEVKASDITPEPVKVAVKPKQTRVKKHK
jgi:hypothetical protein